MSVIRTIYGTLNICCPHCEYINEIDEIDISIVVENTNVGRRPDECAFAWECEGCHKQFSVIPEADIAVKKL